MLTDTCYNIETPEGIDLSLHPAGLVSRVLAYSIDLLIRWAILMVFAIISAFLGQVGSGFMLILYFLLEWFYPTFFEVFRQGMTPGKKSMGIRVIHDDGTPVSWNSALIRNLLRFVDFLPFAYCAGIISIIIGKEFKRIGDLAAGTLVVYEDELNKTIEYSSEGISHLPITLTSDEKAALLNLAERKSSLSKERQQELADILHPLTGVTGEAGVVELTKVANGIVRSG
jgi:uncharacterized RDD family membrane protein YckC